MICKPLTLVNIFEFIAGGQRVIQFIARGQFESVTGVLEFRKSIVVVFDWQFLGNK